MSGAEERNDGSDGALKLHSSRRSGFMKDELSWSISEYREIYVILLLQPEVRLFFH